MIITLDLPTRVDLEGPLCTPGADEPVSRHHSRFMLRDLAAQVLDQNLRFLSRAGGLIDAALGKGIERLVKSGCLLKLGYQGLGDYTHQRLGMSRRNAQSLVALRRRFFDLPRVAAAFLAGEITRSQAEVIGRVADDAYEHEWIEYARRVSFVHLRRLVKARQTIKERSPAEFWDTCRRPRHSPTSRGRCAGRARASTPGPST